MKNNLFRNIIALLIILLGISLILSNIGLVDWGFSEAWYFIYPIFFLLLGLKWCFDALRGKGGWISGSFFVIFGSLLLADRFQYIDFKVWDIYKLWPLLIIYIGFSFLTPGDKRNSKFKIIFDSDDFPNSETMYGKHKKFVIGDHKFNTPNWKVEPMELWNAVGDYHIDFTKAFIPDKHIPIRIHGWAGDIQILMPENIAFAVKAEVKAGEINVFEQESEGVQRSLIYQTNDYEQATRKLTLDLKLKAGSIRINKV
ncbi:cell wall-active antibiotics response protein LiaF [Paraliobacillus salinarum]|uniref:cell wall-active antibiotics response protein LiaF n=1 Tax=Paraliobacillus salinarum TaxID=1158996 RepID=UPI0015F667A8|nr:cell wall-active antibiotics response protein LiaF [Paraliobacillus salinarum]